MELYNKLSDFELADLLKTGDRLAFTEIFNRYNRLLFIHAHKLLNDKEEARDLVQEIFTAIWDNRTSFSVKTNLPGLLYSSTRNRIFDLLSHKKVESKYFQVIQNYTEESEADTDYLLRANELQSVIEKEISFLPTKMRIVFELSRKDNLSHKEIAVQLELSEKTVRNHINNALKILKVKLGLLFYLYFIFLR